MKHEVITIVTKTEDGTQRDFLTTSDWFMALTFAKDAAQADLLVEITSKEEVLSMYVTPDMVDKYLAPREIPESDYGVHASHCCLEHGCKYSDVNCPVINEKVKQEYPCESCTGED